MGTDTAEDAIPLDMASSAARYLATVAICCSAGDGSGVARSEKPIRACSMLDTRSEPSRTPHVLPAVHARQRILQNCDPEG